MQLFQTHSLEVSLHANFNAKSIILRYVSEREYIVFQKKWVDRRSRVTDRDQCTAVKPFFGGRKVSVQDTFHLGMDLQGEIVPVHVKLMLKSFTLKNMLSTLIIFAHTKGDLIWVKAWCDCRNMR